MSAAHTAPDAMRFTATPGADAIDDLGAELDALLAAVDAPVTADRLWVTLWARALGEYTPWVFTVRRGDQLVAAALLATHRRVAIHEIFGAGHGASDYLRLPVLDDDAADTLAAGIAGWLRHRRPWRLRVEQLPVDDPAAAALVRHLHHAAVVPGDGSPRLRFVPGTPVDRLFSAKTRQSLRTARNRLARLDEDVRIETDRGPAAATNLEDLARVHRARDQALGRRCDLDDPTRYELWRTLLTAYAQRDELEVGRLLIGSELAAYSVSFLDGDSYRLWETRFDPARDFVAPGRLLIAGLLERLATEGRFREFDYMRGEEDYKRRMSNDVVPAEHLVAWSSGATRRLEAGYRWARDRTARRSTG